MKQLIFIIAILTSNLCFGAGGQPLKNEITNKLILDLSKVELHKNHEDFVVVNFYISNGEIEITDITGTQKELIQKVKSKMSTLKIQQAYEEGVIYRYKFTFEKK